MFARPISVVDQTPGNTGLTFSFGVSSEAILALSTTILSDDFAVGDGFDLEDRHTGTCFEDTVGLAGDTVEIVVVFVAVGDGRDTFSIDEVEIFGADFTASVCFLDASFNLDILADSCGWMRLKASSALGTFAFRVERETAILRVLGRVMTKSIGEFVV